MLQRKVRSQLAGMKHFSKISVAFRKILGKKTLLRVNYPLPMAKVLNRVQDAMAMLPEGEKHWFCGGPRSSGVAIEMLRRNEIIAVPTDTIYGFAALAQSKTAIDRLYDVKGRDRTKPLAITLSGVTEIRDWAEIDHVPFRLLTDLLPGPVTVVLKRTGRLNPYLNPGHESVGIRVPRSKFITHVCHVIGEPLALTSANLSNEPSSLHPDEFSALWPRLGAVFYDIPQQTPLRDTRRVGSTVVDLTIPGQYEILREGVRFKQDLAILNNYFRPIKSRINNNNSADNDDIAVRESQK